MNQKNYRYSNDLTTLIELVTSGNFHQVEELIKRGRPAPSEFEAKVIEMIQSLLERDKVLEEQAANLVALVNQRTKELEQQKIINVQKSKMSALGEMAGGIAHEINTPLATMKMLASLTQQEIENEVFEIQPVIDKLIKLNLMIDRIAKIIKGLKTFSRDGAGDPLIKSNLRKVVEDTIELCRENIKSKNVSLLFEATDSNFYSDCRDVQISQVVLNLISNAIDAVEKLEEKWIKISLRRDGKYNYIAVTDSGKGISSEIINRIFDPFFSTKDLDKGTGLGLSISQGIIKSHGGDLYVDKSSQNTCFVIQLRCSPCNNLPTPTSLL